MERHVRGVCGCVVSAGGDVYRVCAHVGFLCKSVYVHSEKCVWCVRTRVHARGDRYVGMSGGADMEPRR